MPFVLLGKEYLNLNVKPNMMEKLFGTGNNVEINEYNRREYIYKNLQLVSNIHIDGKRVWNFNNFANFLTNAIE
jgi:hypothetical protein